MNDLTRPSALVSYTAGVGVIASTIYLNNKIGAVSTKLADLTDDVDVIRTGVKEKVPMIENNIKNVEMVIKNIAAALNSQGPVIRKVPKMEKKMSKYREVLEHIMEVLETVEARQLALIDALKAKGSLENVSLDNVKPTPAPKQVSKPKKMRRLVSSDEDSDDSSSEEEKSRSKSKKQKKNKHKSRSDDSDEDEVDRVVRMARGGK